MCYLHAVCARAQVRLRALVLGVFNGTPYLLQPTDWKGLSHHAWLLLGWARMLQHLAEQFGRDLPDVAYTITSSDTPRVSMRAGSVGEECGLGAWVSARRVRDLPGVAYDIISTDL